MKEQYLQIQSNIVRCSFSPGSSIQNIPCVVDAGYFNGTPCNGSAAPVTQVRFTPRKVFHALPEGKPMVKVIKTVDGQRTVIENLKSRFVRTSYRAEVSFTFAENERIFGLGQDEQGVFQKRGTIEYLYQHNMKIPMPIFVSSLGYAVLFDCACLMVFDD
ncbi:MAG: hypothetical protein PHO41_07245, partial [Eubacteriales bacterium]|nr:hypothetical protein [Eubacteriales bacterium]